MRTASGRIDPELPLHEQDLADLDVSFSDFVAGLGLSPAVRELAMVGLASIFGEEASALNTLHRVAVVGSLAGYLGSTGSQVIEQGTGALVEAMVADSAAEVRLSSPVARLRQGGGGVVAETAAGSVAARAAVIALPVNVLAGVEFDPALDPGKLAVSRETAAWEGVKVWAVARGVPPGSTSIGLAHGLDYVVGLEAVARGTLLVCFGPRAAEIDPADRDTVERAVRVHHPGAEVVACAGHDWVSDPWSRGAWAAFRPGQITRHGAALRRQEGRLAFAGADVAVRWPGNIEGAFESGVRVAAEISEIAL